MQKASLIKWKEGGFKSPLSRALGLGSAHGGLQHWLVQRVGGIASLPLAFWLMYSFIYLGGQGYEGVVAWMQKPWNAVLMILSIVIFAQHAALGMQVVIEDYVHSVGRKITALLVMRAALLLVAAISVFSVLKVAL